MDGGCPVVSEASPCPDVPLAAKITVLSEDNTEVATTESDAAGRFQISLPPGEYVLRPTNLESSLLPRAMEVKVTVVSGAFQDVTLQFDSGVRGGAS